MKEMVRNKENAKKVDDSIQMIWIRVNGKVQGTPVTVPSPFLRAGLIDGTVGNHDRVMNLLDANRANMLKVIAEHKVQAEAYSAAHPTALVEVCEGYSVEWGPSTTYYIGPKKRKGVKVETDVQEEEEEMTPCDGCHSECDDTDIHRTESGNFCPECYDESEHGDDL